jgi:hypothetical protein
VNVVKTGLIVYVVGKEPAHWNVDAESTSIKQNIKADLVEIITVKTGHFDISDAWWSLLTRGMKRIVCRIGEFTPKGNLTLTGNELHLCG